MEFTIKEIERQIKRETARIKRIDEKVESLRADRKATKDALAFWTRMLKDCKRMK